MLNKSPEQSSSQLHHLVQTLEREYDDGSDCLTSSGHQQPPPPGGMVGSPVVAMSDSSFRTLVPTSAAFRRTRENLPKPVTQALKQWLLDHADNPYPTDIEKRQLSEQYGLTSAQLNNWFINGRRRYLKKLVSDAHSIGVFATGGSQMNHAMPPVRQHAYPPPTSVVNAMGSPSQMYPSPAAVNYSTETYPSPQWTPLDAHHQSHGTS
jgi:hypothetical protein